jgi:hypothetical protein
MNRSLVLIDLLCIFGVFKTGPLLGSGNDHFSICLTIGFLMLVLAHAGYVVWGESDRHTIERRRVRRVGFAFSFLLACGLTLQSYHSIMTDRNSTAAIGLIFLPFDFGLSLFVFYYVGWGLGILWHQYCEKLSRRSIVIYGLGAIYVFMILAGLCEGIDVVTEDRMIKSIATMQTGQLHEVITDPHQNKKRWVLNALACNKELSREDLFFLANLPDKELHERGRPALVSDACNHKGLAVMRLVALHSNVGPESLDILSQSKNEYVLESVASNSKTPKDVIDRLRKNTDPTIQMAFRHQLQKQRPSLRPQSGSSSALIVDGPEARRISSYLASHHVDDACSADIKRLAEQVRQSKYEKLMIAEKNIIVFIQTDQLTDEHKMMLADAAKFIREDGLDLEEKLVLDQKYGHIFVTAETNACIKAETFEQTSCTQSPSLADTARDLVKQKGLTGKLADDVEALIKYEEDYQMMKYMIARQALLVLEQPQDLNRGQKTMIREAVSLLTKKDFTPEDEISFYERYKTMFLQAHAAVLRLKEKKVGVDDTSGAALSPRVP